MYFNTLDLSILMFSFTRLAHGVTYSSIFRVVPMLTQHLLTSLLVLALEPSVIKDSDTQMSLVNSSIDNSVLDSSSNEQT